MAEGFNRAIVEGNVTWANATPERLVLQVEIVTNRYDFKAKERREQRDRVWCVVPGKCGEFFAKVARVGAFVAIEGRLTQTELTIDGRPARVHAIEAMNEGTRLIFKAQRSEEPGF